MLLLASINALLLFFFVLANPLRVCGHGRMLDPPQRSSLWRFGYSTPPNYDDDGLYCGGFRVQYNSVNQGRCGECGDEWSLPRPRQNDEGGLYGSSGIIAKSYQQGQLIEVMIQLTTSHLGYFEFRLCADKKSIDQLVTQDCFDQHLLSLENDSNRYSIVTSGQNETHYAKVQLPLGITCQFCVLQWNYRTGNNWGDCGNGTGALGCGDQETFRNCADLSIHPTFN